MPFYCKHCGEKKENLHELVNGNCSRSPVKRHEIFEGRAAEGFYCMHCGAKSSDLRELVNGDCRNSPTKKHIPAES